MNLRELAGLFSGLSEANRPIRLRLSGASAVLDDVLLIRSVTGQEAVCGDLNYQLLCVSLNDKLPLKELIALPVELQFVTDRGNIRSVCGIVARAASGESDGGLATYQLLVRDALALMEQRTSTRVFHDKSDVDVVATLLAEWRANNPILARAFAVDMSGVTKSYPTRAFIMQQNESDASFVRRLLKRQGIAWFFRPGRASTRGSNATPAHTLVMFDNPHRLAENSAGTVRFQRDTATQKADSVFSWSAARELRPGSVMRQSWDYRRGGMMSSPLPTIMKQGEVGNQFAASLDDYLIDSPHAGDDLADYRRLSELRMQRHEYEAKCFHGESGVRDFCVGDWIRLSGHPEVDTHPDKEREFVLTELFVSAENNLPKTVDDQIRRLFATNRWLSAAAFADLDSASDQRGMKYTNRFTCVRRGIPIVPAYDPRGDTPRTSLQSALVVGPRGEEVYCDALGRVKLRFPGTRQQDHVSGPGASDTDADSAWVRVASDWASDRWGSISLPRVGDEVLVDFLGGDPDKPVVIGRVYGKAPPPGFSHTGELPGNRFLAGIKSKEVRGIRYNQLRLDDTPGQISAQLASEHGHSELNLGWLTRPRVDGTGKARGEGAELRSDQAVAVRGKGGVLISAEAQDSAGGRMLERDALVELAEVLQGVQRQLSELSETHNAEATETKKLDKLIQRLHGWDVASTLGHEATHVPPPVVAISAPAGVALSSMDSVLLGAQNETDLISVGNTQITTGKGFLVRAAGMVSIFAHKLGVKLVAASAKMELQTHKDDIELTSAKRIVLSAAEEIVLQAPKVRFIAKGAQVDIGGDVIVQQCSGDHTIKSAKFAHVIGGGGSVADLNLPTSDIKTDERIVLFDSQTGLPVKGRAYRAVLEDGQVIEGKTDDEGRTALMQSTAMGEVEITIDPVGSTS